MLRRARAWAGRPLAAACTRPHLGGVDGDAAWQDHGHAGSVACGGGAARFGGCGEEQPLSALPCSSARRAPARPHTHAHTHTQVHTSKCMAHTRAHTRAHARLTLHRHHVLQRGLLVEHVAPRGNGRGSVSALSARVLRLALAAWRGASGGMCVTQRALVRVCVTQRAGGLAPVQRLRQGLKAGALSGPGCSHEGTGRPRAPPPT